MSTEKIDPPKIGRAEMEWTEAEGGRIVRADDLIEVTGEVAQEFGVKPPLDGRVDFGHGYVFDLAAWDGTGSLPGRTAGTYLGRRVRP